MRNDAKSTLQEIRHKAEGAIGDLPSRTKVPQKAVDAIRQAESTPTTLYLVAVFASMALSLLLIMSKRQGLGIFVGLWPPTILSLIPLLRQRSNERRVSDEMESMTRGEQFLTE